MTNVEVQISKLEERVVCLERERDANETMTVKKAAVKAGLRERDLLAGIQERDAEARLASMLIGGRLLVRWGWVEAWMEKRKA